MTIYKDDVITHYKLGYYEGQCLAYERMLLKLGAIASKEDLMVKMPNITIPKDIK